MRLRRSATEITSSPRAPTPHARLRLVDRWLLRRPLSGSETLPPVRLDIGAFVPVVSGRGADPVDLSRIVDGRVVALERPRSEGAVAPAAVGHGLQPSRDVLWSEYRP